MFSKRIGEVCVSSAVVLGMCSTFMTSATPEQVSLYEPETQALLEEADEVIKCFADGSNSSSLEFLNENEEENIANSTSRTSSEIPQADLGIPVSQYNSGSSFGFFDILKFLIKSFTSLLTILCYSFIVFFTICIIWVLLDVYFDVDLKSVKCIEFVGNLLFVPLWKKVTVSATNKWNCTVKPTFSKLALSLGKYALSCVGNLLAKK